MTRLAYWRYQLHPVGGVAPAREGALLRFTMADGAVGYSDCHPWPELGDDPLDDQIRCWPPRCLTPLLDQSMLLAFLDADARREGRSLFAGLTVPPSHLSLPGAARIGQSERAGQLFRAKASGFDRVKVKAGDHPDCDAEWLIEFGKACRGLGLLARLDLNGKLDFDSVVTLLERISSGTGGLAWIDWVEDPCPFGLQQWKRLGSQFGIRLAYDRAGKPTVLDLGEASDVLVYKSALHRVLSYSSLAGWSKLPVCFTTYLDHPVGQLFAAYSAAANVIDATAVETCGLLTHDVYEPNAFSERLKTDGPVLIPPEGTGIGFDDLLENLPWTELN